MLELQHVSFEAEVKRSSGSKRQEIIRDVSLTIGDDRFTIITGPNGSGKTTLAKLIMGIETPTSGRIIFDGVDITTMPIYERARLGICYGFQNPARFKGMTVRKIIALAAGEEVASCKCNDFLTKVGLCSNEYLNREVDKSLSGGELKRIEIATVLAANPKLAIYDEPEAGIDLWSFDRLTTTFKQIHEAKNGHSIIIISHQERIIDLADEVILLKDGQIAAQGSKEAVMLLSGFSAATTTNPECVLIPQPSEQRGGR